ncbi:MAG: potassium channel protein [Planctomycetes bacterium]|nr:potassium channel protein [Planctomycetota bacterium]
MAAITMSTVGYGDYVDVNSLPDDGRATAMTFLIVFNLSSYLVLLYVSGTIASFLIEGSLARFFRRRRMDRLLHEIRGHFIVCGCGTTGRHIVEELAKVNAGVVAMDSDEEAINALTKHYPGLLAIRGDSMDDELLREAGLERAAGLFAALAEDRDNIVLTLSARQMAPAARIVARATQFENIAKLKRVGANAVISPNHIGGLRMASEMVRPAVVTFLDTMLRDHSAIMRFENVSVRAGGHADGRRIAELDISRKLGIAVIGIKRSSGTIEYNPGGDTALHGGDEVISDHGPRTARQAGRVARLTPAYFANSGSNW